MDFYEWLLTETISIHIVGYQPNDLPQNITDLSYYLALNMDKVPEFKQGQRPFYEKITIDGLDVDAPSGVINFYHHGMTALPKLISGIKYYLDELKVKYGEFKNDTSRMFQEPVIRIPILQIPISKKPLTDANMANQVAYHIFRDLFNMREIPQTMSARDLLIKIDSLNDFQIKNAVVPASQDKNHFDMGIDEERIRRKLAELRTICQFAIDNDYDELSIG